MAIPRLNGIIKALESGKNACVCFQPGDTGSAQAVSTEKYDGVVFEMEHGAYDIKSLRDCLQYMLNRQQIAASGSVAPAVTPMVRIPPNGAEMNQWIAKQVLDQGVYGIVWPHISTVEEARNAVDPETAILLREAFFAFNADDAQSVAILTGRGGTFCAGYDLKVATAASGKRVLKEVQPHAA